jgi:hypothetical protein
LDPKKNLPILIDKIAPLFKQYDDLHMHIVAEDHTEVNSQFAITKKTK